MSLELRKQQLQLCLSIISKGPLPRKLQYRSHGVKRYVNQPNFSLPPEAGLHFPHRPSQGALPLFVTATSQPLMSWFKPPNFIAFTDDLICQPNTSLEFAFCWKECTESAQRATHNTWADENMEELSFPVASGHQQSSTTLVACTFIFLNQKDEWEKKTSNRKVKAQQEHEQLQLSTTSESTEQPQPLIWYLVLSDLLIITKRKKLLVAKSRSSSARDCKI